MKPALAQMVSCCVYYLQPQKNYAAHAWQNSTLVWLLKMGLPRPLFVHLWSFQILQKKTVGVSGIWTWIVEVVDKHVDHLTTMALLFWLWAEPFVHLLLLKSSLTRCLHTFRLKRKLKITYFVFGSGCGSVGRAVASDARGLQFESNHRQKFTHIFNICLL